MIMMMMMERKYANEDDIDIGVEAFPPPYSPPPDRAVDPSRLAAIARSALDYMHGQHGHM